MKWFRWLTRLLDWIFPARREVKRLDAEIIELKRQWHSVYARMNRYKDRCRELNQEIETIRLNAELGESPGVIKFSDGRNG